MPCIKVTSANKLLSKILPLYQHRYHHRHHHHHYFVYPTTQGPLYTPPSPWLRLWENSLLIHFFRNLCKPTSEHSVLAIRKASSFELSCMGKPNGYHCQAIYYLGVILFSNILSPHFLLLSRPTTCRQSIIVVIYFYFLL